jgi:hypothetical protein
MRRRTGVIPESALRSARHRSGITSPFERRPPGKHQNTQATGGNVLSRATVPVGVASIIAALLLTT